MLRATMEGLIKLAKERDAEFRKSQIEVSKNFQKDEWTRMSKYYAGKIDDNSFWLAELKKLKVKMDNSFIDRNFVDSDFDQ